MEYKRLEGTELPHHLTFIGEEIDVFKGALTEIAVQQEVNGNTEGLKEWQSQFIAIPADENISKWVTADLDLFHKPLSLFAHMTDSEVKAIMTMPIPTFEMTSLIKRRRYGKIALELANQIREIRDRVPPSEDEIRLFVDGIDNVDLEAVRVSNEQTEDE